MKKMAFIMGLGFLICLLSACQETYDCPAPMTKEKQEQIAEDMGWLYAGGWWSMDEVDNGNQGNDKEYYGTYNGYDVWATFGMTAMHNEVKIAGMKFGGTSMGIVAQKDGETMPLKEAYEKGLISQEDIAKIHEYYTLARKAESEVKKAQQAAAKIKTEG